MAEHAAVLVPEVTEYFPELNGDLTHVVWAHAVNNRSLLTKALNDSSVMMLEADVVLGTIFGQNDIIPIMAHPPQNKSDLSLHMFLETVITSQTKDVKKGVKLDFKSTECFKTSLAVIEPLKVKVSLKTFNKQNK